MMLKWMDGFDLTFEYHNIKIFVGVWKSFHYIKLSIIFEVNRNRKKAVQADERLFLDHASAWASYDYFDCEIGPFVWILGVLHVLCKISSGNHAFLMWFYDLQ